MVCNKCGANNADGVKFCSSCGNELAGGAPVNSYGTPANPYSAPAETPAKTAQPGKGLAVASMVCGIVSFFIFGLVLGVLAIIFGGVAKSKGNTSPMATAGIVCGAIGLGLYLLVLIICGGSMIAMM